MAAGTPSPPDQLQTPTTTTTARQRTPTTPTTRYSILVPDSPSTNTTATKRRVARKRRSTPSLPTSPIPDMATLVHTPVTSTSAAHRTPHSARFPGSAILHVNDDEEDGLDGEEGDVRMALLQSNGHGFDEEEKDSEDGKVKEGEKVSAGGMSLKDKYAVTLLIVLCKSGCLRWGNAD